MAENDEEVKKIPPEIVSYIDEAVRQTSIAVETRLAKTLSSDIKNAIKPMETSKVDILQRQYNDLNEVVLELSSTFFGLWMYNKTIRRLMKRAAKAEEERKAGLIKNIVGRELSIKNKD